MAGESKVVGTLVPGARKNVKLRRYGNKWLLRTGRAVCGQSSVIMIINYFATHDENDFVVRLRDQTKFSS